MKRITQHLFAIGFSIALATPVFAATAAGGKDDPLASFYKNTILSMNQPLYVIRLWLYADGTFKQFEASHETGIPRAAGWEGTYTLQGNPGAYQLCLKYTEQPAPASIPEPTPGCRPIAPHKIGDIWKVSYTTGPHKGTTETFTVTEGHDTQP